MVKRYLFSFFLLSSFCTASAPEREARFVLDNETHKTSEHQLSNIKNHSLPHQHKTTPLILNIFSFMIGVGVGIPLIIPFFSIIESIGLFSGMFLSSISLFLILCIIWHNETYECSILNYYYYYYIWQTTLPFWQTTLTLLILPILYIATFFQYCFKKYPIFSSKNKYRPKTSW